MRKKLNKKSVLTFQTLNIQKEEQEDQIKELMANIESKSNEIEKNKIDL